MTKKVNRVAIQCLKVPEIEQQILSINGESTVPSRVMQQRKGMPYPSYCQVTYLYALFPRTNSHPFAGASLARLHSLT